MVGWLVGWLVDWLVGLLVGWLDLLVWFVWVGLGWVCLVWLGLEYCLSLLVKPRLSPKGYGHGLV